MNRIKCQGSDCKKNGCYSCGGYGYVLETAQCSNCLQEYWTRPGNYTIYDGKKFTSIDGLEITFHLSTDGKEMKTKTTCSKCPQGSPA